MASFTPNSIPDQVELMECVAHLYAEKRYRPTQVFVLQNKWGEYLMMRSPKSNMEWHFPQKGLWMGERPIQNLERWAREETVSVNVEHQIEGFTPGLHYEELDLPSLPDQSPDYTFSLGKAYFVSAAHYTDRRQIRLRKQELSYYAWVKPGQAFENKLKRFSDTGRLEKARLLRRMRRAAELHFAATL